MAGARAALRGVNLGARFALEIAALVALAYGGARVTSSGPLRVALAILAPLAMVVVWGFFVSPKARWRLEDPARAIVEVLLFAAASAALLLAGAPALGAALAAVFALSLALMFAWGQRGR